MDDLIGAGVTSLDHRLVAPADGARIGLGGGALGDLDVDSAVELLDAAADHDFACVDVARSYGAAEDVLGACLRARPELPLAVVTKGGYAVEDGSDDWSAAAVRCAIDDARRRLGRDRLDVFLLHSCAAHVLRRDDVAAALHDALRAGAVRAVGYSGDNDDLHIALDRAAALGLTVVEQSLSLLDGKARVHTLPRARQLGLVVIAKRALANAPWRDDESHDARRQRARLERATLPDVGLPLDELFLRFALFHQGVDVVLVGTRRVEAIARAASLRAKGPLSDDTIAALRPSLARLDDDSLI